MAEISKQVQQHQTKKSRKSGLSEEFRNKFARMMENVQYEELIHRLSEEAKSLEKQSSDIVKRSDALSQERAELDNALVAFVEEWEPAYPGKSILDSEAAAKYRERSLTISKEEDRLRNQWKQLHARIALISDALDTCDHMIKMSHTA